MKTSSMKTNWNQVYALMALNMAVVISWIAYHNYQPKVLALFNFEELSFFLVVAQGVILMFIPSLAGLLGDYIIGKGGDRFVVFTVGISITAMVFMSVAFTIGSVQTINLTAALPFMIVVWLISMNIFHSPANSMLELFAPGRELPSAMALMVVTTDLLYAFENQVVDFIDWIGPVLTFTLGGVLLIISGYYFRRTTRTANFIRTAEAEQEKTNMSKVFAAGLFLGAIAAIIKNSLPDLLPSGGAHFFDNPSWIISFVLVVAAIAAWPLSTFVQTLGLFRSLMYGIVGASACLVTATVIPDSSGAVIGICVLLGIFFSLASVAAFPFALHNLSPRHATVGAGVFFGSVEVVNSIMNIADKL